MENPREYYTRGFCFVQCWGFQESLFSFVGTAASRDILTVGHVAIAAVGLEQLVANIRRMHEIINLCPRRDVLLYLVEYGMTEVAILGY